MRKPRSTRCTALVVIGVVVLAGCTPHPHRRAARPATHAAAHLSPVERVRRQVGAGGGMSATTAKQLFSLEVHPLPGVQVPSGSSAPVPDGSGAIGWLRLYRDELTPAQRTILDAVSPPTSRSLREGGPHITPRGSGRAPAPTPDWVNAEIQRIRSWIGQRLQRELPGFVVVQTDDQRVGDEANEVPITHFGQNGEVRYDGCEVSLSKPWFTATRPEQLDALAHEVFHCFEDSLSGDAQGSFRPDWVQEGQAEWVGDEYAAAQGYPTAGRDPWWDMYLSGATPLFRQSYQAVGFYSLLADRSIDVWSVLDPMYRALAATLPCQGPCPALGDLSHTIAASNAAFAASGVTGGADGNGVVATDDLVSSSVMDPEFGAAWNITGPTAPAVFNAHVLTPAQLPVGGSVTVATGSPAGTKVYDVTLDAPVVTITPDRFRGQVRLPDGTSKKLSDINGSYSFCTGSQCPQNCPGVEDLDVHAGSSMQLAATTVADFTTGPTNGGISQAYELLTGSDACPKPKTPPPSAPRPPGGGGCTSAGCSVSTPGACGDSGCGTLFGDPHLMTYDRVPYDFQAAGEFVASTDPDGGFAVQTRLQPFPGETNVSFTTAVALDVDGGWVEADIQRGSWTLRIDGRSWNASSSPVGHGGRVTRTTTSDGPTLSVTWADGSTVRVVASVVQLLLWVQPSADRGPRLAGLLGSYDGDDSDDVVPRGGRPLSTPIDDADLYPGFADSWRITAATSLFTYAAGRSTGSYTDRSVPHRVVDAVDVADRAHAEQVCRAAGVHDEPYLDDCILDVGFGGRDDLATAAVTVQNAAVRRGSTHPQVVPATSDIYTAGGSDVGPLPGGAGTPAVRVPFDPATTSMVRFAEVDGTVSFGQFHRFSADGGTGFGGTHLATFNGLSGMNDSTRSLMLVGVFRSESPDGNGATATIDAQDDQRTVHPRLGELFHVGDGRIGYGGAVQDFVVPPGASRLYVGFADAPAFRGSTPGTYADNLGAVAVSTVTR